MIPYILHVALLISVCLLFYKIFLQKETFYLLNRVVLLICLGLSFMLPLISIPQAWTLRSPAQNLVSPPSQVTSVQYSQIPISESIKKEAVVKQQLVKTPAIVTVLDTPFIPKVIKWLFYLYWIGVAAFGLNLLLQVVVLLYRAHSNPVILDGKFRIIEVNGDNAPCSFGNNIFINPEKYDWETYNQILMHEKVHIQQGHSLDILLAELVLVFQWFNLFAWLYRSELENNLEFLTDEAVLDHNLVEKSSYQMSLLKVSAPHLPLSVTTNYNQSLLKKRIVMMNAKRSNIHTMWKYFILLPLMGGLACALNQTVAFSQTTVKAKNAKANKTPSQRNWRSTDRSQGAWFATIKGDKVRMEFKGDEDDHNWSSNDDFMLSEFSALPKDQKGDFTLKREAGTMLLNGKFDGYQGYGHYKFTADKEYIAYLNKAGITNIEDNDQFAFFIINIKKEYVEMLKENGYGHISKNELISMAALKVDAPFIKFWKGSGYNLSTNELVSAKALGVNGEYVSEIRKAGYPHISFNQLISFKAQGINAAYIAGLHKANVRDGRENSGGNLPSAEDISSYKALNVDSNYISELKDAGYSNIPFNELTSIKAVGVTPEFIKGFTAIGYKDIAVNELVSLKSLDIKPEYIKSFEDVGYKDITVNELMSLKSLGITPNYIKGFEAMGYKDISINELTSLKSLNITSEYIKSFEAVGYKQIPLNELTSLKALGVTPGFIKGFKDIGYTVSLNEATSLKATGLTPGYVTAMKAKGFNSKDLNKYIQLKNAFN
jgi:hypothetical protein